MCICGRIRAEESGRIYLKLLMVVIYKRVQLQKLFSVIYLNV